MAKSNNSRFDKIHNWGSQQNKEKLTLSSLLNVVFNTVDDRFSVT